MLSFQPTINDVTKALDALAHITIPDGDFEGDPVNSPYLYRSLSGRDQDIVDRVEQLVSEYVRKPGDYGDEVNARSLTEIRKRGYIVNFNPDQYDPERLVGHVEAHGRIVDLSDPSRESDR
jgi:hypothetical protein